MATILDDILAVKRQEIAAAQSARPLRELRAAVRDAPPVRDFRRALGGGGPIKLIAEIKKASPSRGVIRPDFQPLEIARIYAEQGATCLSVLTDRRFFQGGLDILQAVRQHVPLPVLRKDFLLDPYQVFEARAAGADAVLLIAECLDDDGLARLFQAAAELGMAALVELHEPANLERVLALEAALVGINNRNLHTFETDLGQTLRMRAQIPADRMVVGESGIRTRAEMLRLERARVDAVLVGEQLMAAPDIGQAVRALLGLEKPA